MKRFFYSGLLGSILALLAAPFTYAGVATFQDLSVPPQGYENGANLNGSFTSNSVTFSNSYDSTFGSWSGFAYSNKTDSLTAGFGNQYSSIAGSGAGGSSNYGVAFNFVQGDAVIQFSNVVAAQSIDLTNTAYAYYSMRDGDPFSKKFGGASGNDPDFFRLRVLGFNGGASTGSVDFYLADYRFANNAQDYIVNAWQTVNLTSLGAVDSLQFDLTSSDNGAFGMNTPAYFAVDNVSFTAVPEPTSIATGLVSIGLIIRRVRKSASRRVA